MEINCNISVRVGGKLNEYACTHHIIVKRRLTVISHKDWLDEKTHLIDIVPQILGYLKLFITIRRNNNSNVDITVGIGIALAVGTEHQYARLYVETRTYHCLVAAHQLQSFLTGQSCSFIHCCNCFVSSIIERHV